MRNVIVFRPVTHVGAIAVPVSIAAGMVFVIFVPPVRIDSYVAALVSSYTLVTATRTVPNVGTRCMAVVVITGMAITVSVVFAGARVI